VLKWFWLSVNINQSQLHATIGACFDPIFIRGIIVLIIELLSFLRGFARRNVWPISFAGIVYCTPCVDWFEEIKPPFHRQDGGFGTCFADSQGRCDITWSTVLQECEIGASYGNIACNSDFVSERHFALLHTPCRCFEGSPSFGSGHRQISSQMTTSSIAKFPEKFSLTTSKTCILWLLVSMQRSVTGYESC